MKVRSTFASMRTVAFIWMIWFAMGSIAPGNDFTQVFMLFNLAEHYAEHCEEAEACGDQEFSVFEFVSMHYSDHEHRRSAHDEDDHLPFHGMLSAMTLAPPSEVFCALPEVEQSTVSTFTYLEGSGSVHLRAIFRPPHA